MDPLVEHIHNSLNTEDNTKLINSYCDTLAQKRERQKIVNYRQVCLMAIIGKTLELIIKEPIANHLGKLHIMKPSQLFHEKQIMFEIFAPIH